MLGEVMRPIDRMVSALENGRIDSFPAWVMLDNPTDHLGTVRQYMLSSRAFTPPQILQSGRIPATISRGDHRNLKMSWCIKTIKRQDNTIDWGFYLYPSSIKQTCILRACTTQRPKTLANSRFINHV